jgi:hypothetical protein
MTESVPSSIVMDCLRTFSSALRLRSVRPGCELTFLRPVGPFGCVCDLFHQGRVEGVELGCGLWNPGLLSIVCRTVVSLGVPGTPQQVRRLGIWLILIPIDAATFVTASPSVDSFSPRVVKVFNGRIGRS